MEPMDLLIDAQISLRAKQCKAALNSALKVLENNRSPQAQTIIARIAWDGNLTWEDGEIITPWLDQQILEGNPYAFFISALLYQSGQIYEINTTRAIEQFTMAINKGIADAMAGYANLLLPQNEITSVTADLKSAITLLEQSLTLGSREAAYLLGKHYRHEKQTPDNLQKAYYHLNIARLLGHENGRLLFSDIAQIEEANNFLSTIEKSEQTYCRILSLTPNYPCI
jgi:TPR repeat protein